MEVEKGHSEDAGDDEPYISQTSKQAGLHGLKRFFGKCGAIFAAYQPNG